jgi:hypothetical protein
LEGEESQGDDLPDDADEQQLHRWSPRSSAVGPAQCDRRGRPAPIGARSGRGV